MGMLMMGDMNWHAHAGIFVYPIKIAVQLKIPLIIWGEHGRTELVVCIIMKTSLNLHIDIDMNMHVEDSSGMIFWKKPNYMEKV